MATKTPAKLGVEGWWRALARMQKLGWKALTVAEQAALSEPPSRRELLLQIEAVTNILRDAGILEVDKRLKALEQRPRGLQYVGVYRSGNLYERGDAVTHAGALWIAHEDTTARPGDGKTPWQLAVKGDALR